MGRTDTSMVFHFAAACCSTINLMLAGLAFFLPVIITNSTNEKPYLALGIWYGCSTDSVGGDDWKCFSYTDTNRNDGLHVNPTVAMKSGFIPTDQTPNQISVIQGLYTTAVLLLALATYSACGTIGMKKLGYVSGLFNSLAGIFFFASACFMFGSDRFQVHDCDCAKTNGVMYCARSGTPGPSNRDNYCFGWNYTAIYAWIAWIMCNMSAGMASKHAKDDDQGQSGGGHVEEDGATTGKI